MTDRKAEAPLADCSGPRNLPPFVPSLDDPIHWLSKDLRALFGGPVRKVGLDLGGTCPNRDGTLSTGGCAWCDPCGSGPDDTLPGEPWLERLTRLAERALSVGEAGVIAYFQAFTSTYGLDAEARRHVPRRALCAAAGQRRQRR